ncbi:ParB/RepB/Spo0J family partition protein [Kitasatospora sp. NPDC090091]|uniref:ParB/RepB/Spo0J family partition protein n=1 Tax=Kitasatospora sp. NPDC090091 TaxID=3364081 RepID=UPI00380A3366
MASDPVVDEPGIDPNNRRSSGPARWIPTEQCRFNPRNPRDLGDLSDLDSVDVSDLESIAVKQLQSCLAVTRDAYLKLWPDDEFQLGPEPNSVVIISGNRRLAGAMKYGQPQLIVVVDDSHAESKAALLRAAYDENTSRKDFDPIEEARALVSIVAQYASAREAAAVEGWSPTVISHRKNLLKLHPTLQQMVRSKASGGDGIAIRHAREIGATDGIEQMTEDEQLAVLHRILDSELEAAQRRREERAAKKAAKREALEAAARQQDAGPDAGAPEAAAPQPRSEQSTIAPVVITGASGGPQVFSMENTDAPETDGANHSGSAHGDTSNEPRPFSMENTPATAKNGEPASPAVPAARDDNAVPSPRESLGDSVSGGSVAAHPRPKSSGGLGLPDWQDLPGVAAWLCRALEPSEARFVAETVLEKIQRFEETYNAAEG